MNEEQDVLNEVEQCNIIMDTVRNERLRVGRGTGSGMWINGVLTSW
jgi:hypothetical protein